MRSKQLATATEHSACASPCCFSLVTSRPDAALCCKQPIARFGHSVMSDTPQRFGRAAKTRHTRVCRLRSSPPRHCAQMAQLRDHRNSQGIASRQREIASKMWDLHHFLAGSGGAGSAFARRGRRGSRLQRAPNVAVRVDFRPLTVICTLAGLISTHVAVFHAANKATDCPYPRHASQRVWRWGACCVIEGRPRSSSPDPRDRSRSATKVWDQ